MTREQGHRRQPPNAIEVLGVEGNPSDLLDSCESATCQAAIAVTVAMVR
jgi:hypothetical protein